MIKKYGEAKILSVEKDENIPIDEEEVKEKIKQAKKESAEKERSESN